MEDIWNKLEEDSNKYKNIGQIQARLKNSGYLSQYYEMINEIFAKEHEFTIQELIKIKSQYNQDFDFADFYQMNQDIFKTNFNIISQNIIETVSLTFKQKVQGTSQQQKITQESPRVATVHEKSQQKETDQPVSQFKNMIKFKLQQKKTLDVNQSFSNLDDNYNLKYILNGNKSNKKQSKSRYLESRESSNKKSFVCENSQILSNNSNSTKNKKNVSFGGFGSIKDSQNKSKFEIIENSELSYCKGGQFDKQPRKLTENKSETGNIGPGHYHSDTNTSQEGFSIGKMLKRTIFAPPVNLDNVRNIGPGDYDIEKPKVSKGFTIGQSSKKSFFEQQARSPDRLYNHNYNMLSRPIKIKK